MKILRIFACLSFAFALASPALTEQTAVRKLSQDIILDADKVHVTMSIGNLTIEGTDGKNVSVELTLDCDRVDPEVCQKRADRVRLAPRRGRKALKVKLKNTSRAWLRGINAHMIVRIPRHAAVEVDVNSGNLDLSGMHANVNVNSGGGDVDIVAERSRTNEVEVDIGFGKGNLWLGEERIEATGWPRALQWKGTGDARIDVAVVGNGDVSVRLVD